MTIQQLETLNDKSKERLLYYVEFINPKLSKTELQNVLNDFKKKPTKNKQDFIKIDKNKSTKPDYSKLAIKELELLYKIFISREDNSKNAIKWRLNQYLKYCREITIDNIQINISTDAKQVIDFLIETKEKQLIAIACFDVLEQKAFEMTQNEISNFAKSKKKKINRVIFATFKVFRNIKIDESFKIDKIEVKPELWIEYMDDQVPFDSTDLLIIDNPEINLAGFNFTHMDDLLNYIYENTDGGQISIFKQPIFFSEYVNTESKSENELLWKGIMIKTKIM